MRKIVYAAFVLAIAAACNNEKPADDSNNTGSASIPAPIAVNYNIVSSFPHDTSSYTQGLTWVNNALYESTGLEGHSKLMKIDLKTGKPQQEVKLANEIFGEGITLLNGKIYQLTWMNHKVYVYDANTLQKVQEFNWDNQGWGITHNGTDLIISTGSNNLYFVDPNTFAIKNVLGVFDNNGPVGNLNELEFIDGAIYANVYTTDYIVKIDPANGHVTGRLDMTGLLEKSGKTADKEGGNVLNGIAYDSTRKSLYITGKKWPLLYEVKLQ